MHKPIGIVQKKEKSAGEKFLDIIMPITSIADALGGGDDDKGPDKAWYPELHCWGNIC